MRRCSAILLTLFVFLPVCYGGDNETMTSSTSTPALSVAPSTTNGMMLIITIGSTLPTSSAVLSTTTATPSVSPTTTAVPPDNEDIPVLEWIRGNPIITGLSGATLILSLLLVCMCYLWCCKKQKITVYEIVDISKSDHEEDPSDGEVVSNPWAGHNGTAATTTEPSTELELQTTQANSVVVRITDHDKEMDTAKEQGENQETVTVDMQEETPQMDSMTIDWPEELGSLTNLS